MLFSEKIAQVFQCLIVGFARCHSTIEQFLRKWFFVFGAIAIDPCHVDLDHAVIWRFFASKITSMAHALFGDRSQFRERITDAERFDMHNNLL